jgi:hypothetical protein
VLFEATQQQDHVIIIWFLQFEIFIGRIVYVIVMPTLSKLSHFWRKGRKGREEQRAQSVAAFCGGIFKILNHNN